MRVANAQDGFEDTSGHIDIEDIVRGDRIARDAEEATEVEIKLIGVNGSTVVVKVEGAIVEILVVIYIALCLAEARVKEVGILYQLIIISEPGIVLCLGDKP